MADEKPFQGGEFLITDAGPAEVFTPEDHTKEQKLIAKSAEEFGSGEVDPVRDELREVNPELLRKLLKKAAELGLLGADVPEIYDGMELDKVSSALITEKLSRGCAGFTISWAAHTGIGSLPIVLFGTPAQKKKYVPRLVSADMIGAYALTEPEHGSDALTAEATAVLSEDKTHYVLNGQKQFITNAGIADLYTTYAQVNDDQFTGFIVERAWDGVSLDEEEEKMGMHGTSTRSVIFQDVKVPVENLLGEIGRGHVVALNTLNMGRFKLAAGAVGECKLLIADTVKWAKGRVQFGKPICEFGLIKEKIARIVVRTYAMESMVCRTARLLDMAIEGIDHSQEDAGVKVGQAIREYALECSINKLYASEGMDDVADHCVQIMGGYGYIQDNVAESSYRDARINRIWEGTNEINRLLIVDLLMRAAMKGKLDLFGAVKKVAAELAGSAPAPAPEEGPLAVEKGLVGAAKRIALLAAGAAAQKHMQKLGNEQEIVGLISDIVVGIFAMESVLLRALKKIEKEGPDEARTHVAVARVHIHDTFPGIERMAREIFAAISEGEALVAQLKGLHKLARHVPADTVALRREIADSIISSGRYHLTRT